MDTLRMARWVAPLVLATGLTIAALVPNPAHAQDDRRVRVIVDAADVVVRGGQPYYRYGGYRDSDRIVIGRDPHTAGHRDRGTHHLSRKPSRHLLRAHSDAIHRQKASTVGSDEPATPVGIGCRGSEAARAEPCSQRHGRSHGAERG